MVAQDQLILIGLSRNQPGLIKDGHNPKQKKQMEISKQMYSLCLVICALSCFISAVLSQDVLGAGGFIRSKKNIDFSRIHVELYIQTPGGGQRKVETTDAAPNNGYYFIPVEEVGTYILKPAAPRGWKIEPEERVVSIDGKTDNHIK